MFKIIPYFIPLLILFFTLVINQATHSAPQFSIAIDDNIDVSITRYFNKLSDTVLIWLPGEDGFQKAEFTVGRNIQHKIESWYPDIFDAYFLPAVPSSLNKIPPADIASLINAAAGKKEKIILIGSGRGVLPLLSGAHYWQTHHPDKTNLIGIILISPNFYQETPDPGEAALFLDIISKSNLPIFIVQPKLSPWYWKLPQSMAELEKGGSNVYLRTLPAVRDRFYYRPDATSIEKELSSNFTSYINQTSELLRKLPYTLRAPLPLKTISLNQISSKKQHKLRPYKGNPKAPQLRLDNLEGKLIDLDTYRGQVVLVNFWASWCPPCVHEMPSMQRLHNSLATEPFVILGVNMAEDKSTIQNFVTNKVKVNFPILLDRDGAALKSWQVFAFPTSYLLDKKGNIRYALFGSVEWDDPDKVAIIKSLISE